MQRRKTEKPKKPMSKTKKTMKNRGKTSITLQEIKKNRLEKENEVMGSTLA